MKKTSIIFLSLFIILCLCGCDKNNFKGKTFVYESSIVQYKDLRGNDIKIDNHYEYQKREQEGDLVKEYIKTKKSYSFISETVVKYKYMKDETVSNSYNCEYNIEDNIIKIKCHNEIEVFSYKDNCLINENETKYCIKK